MKPDEELLERKRVLEKKIMTLEWDKEHRQIHAGQNRKLEEYRAELEDLNKQLDEKV